MRYVPSHPEPGGIYNVGTGIQTTLSGLVALVSSTLNGTAAPQWRSMESRPWDTPSWCGDIQRIRAALHWEPRCAVAEGVQRLADWLVQHPELGQRYRAPSQAGVLEDRSEMTRSKP